MINCKYCQVLFKPISKYQKTCSSQECQKRRQLDNEIANRGENYIPRKRKEDPFKKYEYLEKKTWRNHCNGKMCGGKGFWQDKFGQILCRRCQSYANSLR